MATMLLSISKTAAECSTPVWKSLEISTTPYIAIGDAARLTGDSRIEAVFRAHFGDDLKILAASDQTDYG